MNNSATAELTEPQKSAITSMCFAIEGVAAIAGDVLLTRRAIGLRLALESNRASKTYANWLNTRKEHF